MVRSLLTEFAMFVAPFAVYAAFLWATRAGVLHPDSWPLPIVAGLSLTAAVLMVGSVFFLAEYTGAPAGSSYEPAHIEKGRLVPGQSK